MIRMALAVAVAVLAAPAWTEQQSGVTARLRGISAVSDRVAWASGSGGTVVRTADGGADLAAIDDSRTPRSSTSATSMPSATTPRTS